MKKKEISEETMEEQAIEVKKARALDPVAISLYGDKFDGYQKLAEYVDLLPAFKEYYYYEKKMSRNATISRIVRGFNEQIEPTGRKFYPYTQQIRIWRKKWDPEILDELDLIERQDKPERRSRRIIHTKDANGMYKAPTNGQLETAAQTLGGELLNDAFDQLQEDRINEENYTSDEFMKRKKYVVDVFAHVTKMVHGRAKLEIDASKEKREDAGFIMDLMRAAASGDMSPDAIEEMKKVYQNGADPIIKEADVVA